MSHLLCVFTPVLSEELSECHFLVVAYVTASYEHIPFSVVLTETVCSEQSTTVNHDSHKSQQYEQPQLSVSWVTFNRHPPTDLTELLFSTQIIVLHEFSLIVGYPSLP